MHPDTDQLHKAIEQSFGRRALLIGIRNVSEHFDGETVWEGLVHVFVLNKRPEAVDAYAWTSPIEGDRKRRIYTVLGKPPIKSAADAVRAAIVAEHKNKPTA